MAAYLVWAGGVEVLADEGDTVIDPAGDVDLGPDARAVITGRGGAWTLVQPVPTGGPQYRPGVVASGRLEPGGFVQIGEIRARFGVGDPSCARRDDRYLNAALDDLTGTFRRSMLRASLARLRPPGAVLAVDLDRFKIVNDRHGFWVGDGALRATAARLRAHVRWPELVARYGGEEFAVVLPGVSLAEARLRAEAIRAACEPPVVVDDESVVVTVSIGVAALGDHRDLLRAADENLGRAKVAGRNRVVG